MISRLRATALAYLVLLALPVTVVAQQSARPAAAAAQTLSASDAHAKALAGEVVLVDIRTPDEWRETGVAASAHAINMYEDPKVFAERLLAAVGGDRSRRIALICRTGNRSSHLQAQLVRAGFNNVADVSEGMAGSRAGKGWLKAGLPTRPGAQASLPPSLSAKAPPK